MDGTPLSVASSVVDAMEVYASCGLCLVWRAPTPIQPTESPSFKSSNDAMTGTDPWTSSARTCYSRSAARPRFGRRYCTPSSPQRRSRKRRQPRPKGATRRSTARPVCAGGRGASSGTVARVALATAGGSAHLRSGLGRLVSHCVLGRRPRRACGGGRRRRRHACRLLGRLRLLRASPLPALVAEAVRRLLPQLLCVLRAKCLRARLPCPLFTAVSDSPPARTVRPVVLRAGSKGGGVIMLRGVCAGVQAVP